MSGPRPKGRGRHVAAAQSRTAEWDWEVSLPPAAPGAARVAQPPETMPTGIDLSELPRTAYAEHLAAGGRPYPSRRALRAAEAAGSAGPPGAGFPGAVGVDTRPRPPAGTDGADGAVPDDAEASGGRAGGADGSTDGASSTAGVMRSSALMAAGTLVSRILGMVRAVVVTAILGIGPVAGAFSVANTLPNNLYILVAGGALNAVLVPQITRAMRRGAEGRAYVDQLLSVSLVLLGVASVVVTALAPLFVTLFANFTPETYGLAVAFAYWCLPQVFFYGMYTLLGQVLNARGSFGPYMWAPVVNNVVAILGMLCFLVAVGGTAPELGRWTGWQVLLFGGTATLGVVAQALVLVPVLRRSGFSWRFRWGLRGVGLGGAGKVAAWTLAAVFVGQAGYAVASKVTSYGGELAKLQGIDTGNAVYAAAYLIFVLPHSLVAVSLVTAIFTRMSRSAAADRLADVRADLSLGLRSVGVATVLASAAFLVLGRDLAYVMFVGTPRKDTDQIGWVATFMAVGLVAYSAQYLAQRVFYAFEDARTPFVIQVAQTIVWVACLLAARYTVDDGVTLVAAAGAALAVSLIVGACLSLLRVRARLGGMDGGPVLRTHVRLVVGALLAGVAGWSVKTATAHFLGLGWGATAVSLAGASVVMIGVYVAVLKVLQVRELDDLVAPVVGRLRRG